ncbi:centrosomal protein of 131 kDa isoform X2 [Ciona intestinalis]
MNSSHSSFGRPVDLTLSGSQVPVSPPKKSRPLSARSSSSSIISSSSRRSRTGNSPSNALATKTYTKLDTKQTKHNAGKARSTNNHTKPSLAMSFPSKENKKPIQTNMRHRERKEDDRSICSDEHISSFFEQSSQKSRSKSRSTSSKNSRPQSNVSVATVDRVFSLPDSARSSSTVNTNWDEEDGSGDKNHSSSSLHDASDVDFLRSYLSNMNKYKDDAPAPPTSSESTPRYSSHPPSINGDPTGSGCKGPTSGVLEDPLSSRLSLESFEQHESEHLRDVGNHMMREDQERSARKIQIWFRRHMIRKKTSDAALKRMLHHKKEEFENNILRESLKRRERTEEEKKVQREKKAKEARRQAIKELKEKRREKDEAMKKIAEEEVANIRSKMERKSHSKPSSVASNKSGRRGVGEGGRKKEEDVVDQLFDSSSRLSNRVDEVDGPMSSSTHDTQEAISDVTPTNQPLDDTSKSRTTLDDVLETIRKLEEEPDKMEKPKSSLEEKLAWIDELQSENQSTVSKATTSHSQNKTQDQPDASNLLTEAKLHSIMNFLDEVEKTEVAESPVNHPVEHESANQLMKAEEAATEAITSQMLKMKLDLDEKTKSVSLLKRALSQQKDLMTRHLREQEKETEQRLKMQKVQYEATIQRHLSFIDQLIDDKKSLNEKCEQLLSEMKQLDKKYQTKIKQLTEGHEREFKKAKDVMNAAEKLRREKWIDEKTKKIKEMTVKGLEPEIQRLIAKHKEEIKKTKSIQEAELLRSDERAGQRYIRQTEELREQLEIEKESACKRERETARIRYEQQMEQEDIAFQQQKKRLYSEVAEEKERLHQQALRQRSELDQLKRQLEDNSRIATSTIRDEFEKSTHETSRRHQEEMNQLKEKMELEKQAWQENYMKKQESFILQKERELKESVRRDRDNEIDVAIQRLEDDMHHQREELEKTTDNRIKRIRDKYESEMKEVEKSEKQTQEKYNAMKVEFNEIESENLRLQSLSKQKEQEVTDILKIKDKLVEERGNVTEVIRQEFADRLVLTEQENKRIKTELSEMRARQRLELERINGEKEEELAEVHKRVRQAIIKKEETISQIRQQHEAAVKRADHLEGLLETQRKQLLGKKK